MSTFTTGTPSAFEPDQAGVKAVLERFKEMYWSGEGTDFTIACGESMWRVHRFVLTMHSDALARACDWPLRRGWWEGVLDLSAHGHDCVEAFIFYLYNFNLRDNSPRPLQLHVALAILADTYDLPHLAEFALKTFKACCSVPDDLDLDLIDLVYSMNGPIRPFRDFLVESLTRADLPERKFTDIILSHTALAQDVALAQHRQLANESWEPSPADWTSPDWASARSRDDLSGTLWSDSGRYSPDQLADQVPVVNESWDTGSVDWKSPDWASAWSRDDLSADRWSDAGRYSPGQASDEFPVVNVPSRCTTCLQHENGGW